MFDSPLLENRMPYCSQCKKKVNVCIHHAYYPPQIEIESEVIPVGEEGREEGKQEGRQGGVQAGDDVKY